MGEILATPGAVRRLIKAYGFRLKKSLGQNFLVDRNILDKIIRVAELQPSDIVLEIGPGVGGLTQALAEAGASVVAVEIDKNLVAILGEVLADYPQIRVVHGDALQLPLAELLPAGRKGRPKLDLRRPNIAVSAIAKTAPPCPCSCPLPHHQQRTTHS
jgi:16S rRNA A1518/A1519 N6-dimethyltransferase RsmA/KsgA/DIM1 with predicted DNA glycosylase/AP lyase activity